MSPRNRVMDRARRRLPRVTHLPDPTTVLVSEVRMTCIDAPADRGSTLPTSLVFDPGDPYAVALVFHTSAGDIRWLVDRELLVRAGSAPAGEGDVMAWPAHAVDGRPVVVMRLQAPSGRLVLRVDVEDLDDFLWRSLALVPIGTESDHVDVDALVAHLLGSAG